VGAGHLAVVAGDNLGELLDQTIGRGAKAAVRLHGERAEVDAGSVEAGRVLVALLHFLLLGSVAGANSSNIGGDVLHTVGDGDVNGDGAAGEGDEEVGGLLTGVGDEVGWFFCHAYQCFLGYTHQPVANIVVAVDDCVAVARLASEEVVVEGAQVRVGLVQAGAARLGRCEGVTKAQQGSSLELVVAHARALGKVQACIQKRTGVFSRDGLEAELVVAIGLGVEGGVEALKLGGVNELGKILLGGDGDGGGTNLVGLGLGVEEAVEDKSIVGEDTAVEGVNVGTQLDTGGCRR
jgi:hypothetical protein